MVSRICVEVCSYLHRDYQATIKSLKLEVNMKTRSYESSHQGIHNLDNLLCSIQDQMAQL